MTWRNRHMLNRTCRIERPNVTIPTGTTRDRIVRDFTTVKDNVPCRLESTGAEAIGDAQLGRTVVERFQAYFMGGEPVKVNDRLLIDNAYYIVDSVRDYTEHDAHVEASVRKQGYATS